MHDRKLKVFTAGLGVETNTFSPMQVEMRDFAATCLFRHGTHPDELTEVSAPLAVLRARSRDLGWSIVEGPYAFALPAGRVAQDVYEALRDEIIEEACRHAPYDFIVLSLHGAMSAQGYDDCEGDLLVRLRNAIGEDTPIGAELDAHAHLSDAMFESTDILVAFKEYPHTDFLPRAEELINALERSARHSSRPKKAMVDCRTIGRFHTTREPMRSFVDAMRKAEDRDGVWSISLIHGFPWSDVYDMGAKVIAYADKADVATEMATRFAEELIRIRDNAFTKPLPMAEAIDQAISAPGQYVIADVGDNPGGGAPGNSTLMLRHLLMTGVAACTGPLWDPRVVARAFEIGVGAQMTLSLGGPPLEHAALVKALARQHGQSWAATRMPLGDCCVLSLGGVDVVVSSVRDQAYSPDLFTGLGLILEDYKLVTVKSAQHFMDGFSTVTPRILLASGGGVLETDFRCIDYRNVRRPIWPLDL